jgi:hypothetical protein
MADRYSRKLVARFKVYQAELPRDERRNGESFLSVSGFKKPK